MPLLGRGGGERKDWGRLAMALVGVAVAAVSFFYLRAWAVPEAGVRLPVPERDIPAYEVIRAEDLGWAVFPSAAGLEGAVTSPAEAVGKVAAAPLARGWPISRKALREAEAAGSVQVVAVNVDFARTAGAKPGDVVDVYWLRPEQSSWTPGSAAVLLARDALVLGVYDKTGRPAVVPSQAGAAMVVTLAVKPQEVQAVVAGAVPDSKNIALVKKFSSREEVGPVAPVRQEGGEATGGAAQGAPTGGAG